jgi:hypothetical protein
MKTISLFAMLYLSIICCYSQPSISWQKFLGGFSGNLRSIQQTTDGGYIIAGTSEAGDPGVSGNHGVTDYWVVRLNDDGTVKWQKSLGGTGFEAGSCILQTTDGGYIVVGSSSSINGDVTGNHGSDDCWVVKLSDTGIIEWQKSLGGSSFDGARSIVQTTDGGYVIAGDTQSINGDVAGNHGSSDCWVVKLSNSGTIQWQKCFGGSGADIAAYILQTIDGGYIISGITSSNNGDVSGNHGGIDSWVVKLTNSGIIQWQRCLGGSSSEQNGSILQTSDGGYIIAGSTLSNNGDVTGNHGGVDFWIVKLANSGIIQWQKCLGGTKNEFSFSIGHTTDGGYIIAGRTESDDKDVAGNHAHDGHSDMWIVKVTNAGIVEWQKCFGGTGEDYPYSIQQTTDNGYIIAGNTNSHDGDVARLLGDDFSNDWIVKLNSTLSTRQSIVENFKVYPNPVKEEIHVNLNEITLGLSYIIYDNVGRSIMKGKLDEANSIIKTENLSKGVYFLSIGENTKSLTKIFKD